MQQSGMSAKSNVMVIRSMERHGLQAAPLTDAEIMTTNATPARLMTRWIMSIGKRNGVKKRAVRLKKSSIAGNAPTKRSSLGRRRKIDRWREQEEGKNDH